MAENPDYWKPGKGDAANKRAETKKRGRQIEEELKGFETRC